MRIIAASLSAVVVLTGTAFAQSYPVPAPADAKPPLLEAQAPPSPEGVGGAPAPQPVLSAMGPYVLGQFGGSFPTNDPYDNSISLGGGAGYRFTPTWRADAVFTYRPNIGPSLSNWTLMANAYYDFNNVQLSGFVPYLKAGLGISQNSVGTSTVRVAGSDTPVFGSDETDFAWDVGAGLSYALNARTAVDIDYQYVRLGQTPSAAGSGVSIPSSGHLWANEVKVGLRFGF